MLRIGGSQKNAARQRLIRAMPEWMKPSGAFGIGLQSAFLLSDCIYLKTKSIFSNETLELELHSPLGPNEGLVLVRQVPNDVAQRCGTTLEIRFQLDRFARRWSVPSLQSNDDSVATQLVMSMDPLLDDSFPYDAGIIVDEVLGFGKNSLIGIECEFAPLARERMSLTATSGEAGDWLFLPDAQGHCVAFRYQPHPDVFTGHHSQFLYRGQPFKCDAARFPHVNFEINLLSGTAGTWLSANRDQLTPKAADDIRAVVLSALKQAVEADMTRHSNEPTKQLGNRSDLSLFLHAMALNEGEPWEGFAAQIGDAWKDVSLIGSSIRECFDKSEWLFDTGSDVNDPIVNCDVSVPRHHGSAVTTLALLAWEKEKSGSVRVLSVDDLKCSPNIEDEHPTPPARIDRTLLEIQRKPPILHFSLTRQPCYSDAALAEHLIKAINPFSNCRYLVAIIDERWQRLALRKNVQLYARRLIQPCADAPSTMLLPHLFSGRQAQVTPSQLERLCDRIHPLLADGPTVHEVRDLYRELITYIDDELMAASRHATYWRTARSG